MTSLNQARPRYDILKLKKHKYTTVILSNFRKTRTKDRIVSYRIVPYRTVSYRIIRYTNKSETTSKYKDFFLKNTKTSKRQFKI